MGTLHGISIDLGEIFKNYAAKGGDPDTLCKAELKQLFKEEYKSLKIDLSEESRLNKFFEELDKNKDDKVDFEEFCKCFTNYSVVLYKFSDMLA